uniref:Uncharacterized protein n=1 Tax=Anguilla anguilla TaxID=7936 RepID=A0A0E9P9K0_ANGAN
MRWASMLQIHSDSTSPRRRGIIPDKKSQNSFFPVDCGDGVKYTAVFGFSAYKLDHTS